MRFVDNSFFDVNVYPQFTSAQGCLRASDSADVAPAAERLEFDNRLKTALCRQSFTKNREAGFGNATENHFLCEDGGNIWI